MTDKKYNTSYDDKSNAIVFSRKLMDVLVNIDSQYMSDLKHLVNLRRYVRLDPKGKFDVKKQTVKIHIATCLGIRRASFYTLFSRVTLKGFLICHESGIYSYNPEYLIFERRGDMKPYIEELSSRDTDNIKKAHQEVKKLKDRIREKRKFTPTTPMLSAIQQ